MQTLTLPLLLAALPTPADADTLSATHRIPHVEISAGLPDTDPALAPLSTTTLTAREIQAAHTPSLLPLLTAVVPSLFVTERSLMGYGLSTGAAGGIKVRGVGSASATGVLVVVDDEPMIQGLMGHTVADMYQSMMAESVEVVRGPASVRYGSDALSGVVHIRTREALPTTNDANRTAETQLHASYGTYHTLSSGFSQRMQSGRYAQRVSASYDRSDGQRAGLDYDRLSGYLKSTLHCSEHWRLTWQGYATHLNSGNPGTTQSPLIDNTARATRGFTSLSLTRHGARSEGRARLYYTFGDHTINDGYAPDAEPLDYLFHSRDFIYGLSWEERFEPWRGGLCSVGIESKRYGGKAWNEYHEHHHRTYSIDTAVWEAAVYLCVQQQVGQHLRLDGGLRWDYAEGEKDRGTWIPQAGITWTPDHQTTLRASVSRGFRRPSLRERYLWAAANPELRAEELVNYEVSVGRWWCRRRLHLQATLFSLHATNLIETVSVAGRPHNENTGEQRNRGLEVEAIWQPASQWTFSANYSYLHTQQPVISAPRRKAYATLQWQGRHLRLAPSLLYVDHLYTDLSTRSIQHYYLLNVDAAWQLRSAVQLFAHGENLLGQRYETLYGYPMPRATLQSGVRFKF